MEAQGISVVTLWLVSCAGGLLSAVVTSFAWYLVLSRKRDWSRVVLKLVEAAPTMLDKLNQLANISMDGISLYQSKMGTRKHVTIEHKKSE